MKPDTHVLFSLHEKPSDRKIVLSRLAIIITVFFWIFYILSVIFRQFIDGPQNYNFTMEAISYSIVVSFLTLSALLYLLARQGALQRFKAHVRVPRAVIDKFFTEKIPTITVLIPSYNEETQVIRKTLISAALQEYGQLRLVLLIDDNVIQESKERQIKLQSTIDLKKEIEELFQKPRDRFTLALDNFEKKYHQSKLMPLKEIKNLANDYSWAADWLENMAKKEEISDHVDQFFTNQVLGDLAEDLKLVAKALNVSVTKNAQLSKERVHQLYRRLNWIFKTEIEIFQRKKYASLSHEPNKAMNLNSYIGLMGGCYQEELTPDGPVLIRTKNPAKSSLIIPDSDYILTLDADSILLKDYCLRLVYFLEQPNNSDVAVTQTPYSSFKGATSKIERLSGATTDIQHILHQGMSYYGATFWVGANAVIRKKALDDIVRTEWVGGFEVKRYIQDNTVIEDTESSIDLGSRGWRLVNYPERLSYSATPPDFGSLVVQRRRWANGGLLILPKFISQINDRNKHLKPVPLAEILLRMNYMASIAWSNFGLVFLLAYPYDGRLLSPLVLFAAAPYFLAMASDLKYNGYRYSDIFRIYGFNLILLPVNLAGVLKSLQQALTAKKIPFARTPKVKDRTVTELPFVIFPLLIVGFSVLTLWRNIDGQNWGNAAFAGFNALTATWAIFSYIGFRNLLIDIGVGVTNYLYVEDKPKNEQENYTTESELDWKSILYHGDENGQITHHSLKEMLVVNHGKLPSKSSKS